MASFSKNSHSGIHVSNVLLISGATGWAKGTEVPLSQVIKPEDASV